MLLRIDVNAQKKSWGEFIKDINGEFKFTEDVRANVDSPIYLFKGNYDYKKLKICIEQGMIIRPFKNDIVKALIFSMELETRHMFNLSMWEKDFFDRIFSFRSIRTEDKDFDTIFCIEGSNKRQVLQFFKNERIRNVFLTDRSLMLRVFTKDNKIRVEMKRNVYMEKKEELHRLNNIFQLIIDKLINLGVM